jgi:hypothetical protein
MATSHPQRVATTPNYKIRWNQGLLALAEKNSGPPTCWMVSGGRLVTRLLCGYSRRTVSGSTRRVEQEAQFGCVTVGQARVVGQGRVAGTGEEGLQGSED